MYRACKDTSSRDCDYCIKVQRFNGQAKAELRAYQELAGSGITPKLHAAWKSANKLYLVLDRLRPCKPRLRRKQVFALLDRLERRSYLHVDTHSDNVMCTKSQRACLIDYGWAVRLDEPIKRHPSGCRCLADLREAQTANVREYFR